MDSGEAPPADEGPGRRGGGADSAAIREGEIMSSRNFVPGEDDASAHHRASVLPAPCLCGVEGEGAAKTWELRAPGICGCDGGPGRAGADGAAPGDVCMRVTSSVCCRRFRASGRLPETATMPQGANPWTRFGPR